jgi:hypothetical protein
MVLNECEPTAKRVKNVYDYPNEVPQKTFQELSDEYAMHQKEVFNSKGVKIGDNETEVLVTRHCARLYEVTYPEYDYSYLQYEWAGLTCDQLASLVEAHRYEVMNDMLSVCVEIRCYCCPSLMCEKCKNARGSE